MNSLFSKHSCRPESDAVLCALLTIFSSYIKRMRKTKEGEDLYSWVSSEFLVACLEQKWLDIKSGGKYCDLLSLFFLVRVTGSGVSALDYRRDCYHAHSCSACHGYPANSGLPQR